MPRLAYVMEISLENVVALLEDDLITLALPLFLAAVAMESGRLGMTGVM